MCAFEVVEHLAEPAETFRELAPAANALLVGTEPYLGQGNDWWYLTPTIGQHVFFFSPQGFQWLAHDLEMHLIDLGTHQLLTRAPLSSARERALRLLVRRPIQQLVRARLAYGGSYDSAERDAGFSA